MREEEDGLSQEKQQKEMAGRVGRYPKSTEEAIRVNLRHGQGDGEGKE